MPQKIVTDRNSSREVEIKPFIKYEQIEEIIKKTFSHLFGWNESGEKWIRVRVDNSGRLITSVPGLATEWKCSKISAGTTAGSTTLSKSYQAHLIKNAGTADVYISFSGTATANDYPLAPGEVLSIDIDTNKIYYKSSSGTQTIYWITLR